ncbi:TPA: hypothetical protein JAJ60_000271 [Corynebacterium striatum]|nr:hypothetical protein [Corynebacterium striatum]MCG7248763.1 hypothetical protein [Corynebacterium striatum]HAT1143756.1 hypothetical protein [Corynebacterium striatum]HAT1151834.1 hypothetical protein [Corynebacterium striatum]HAT1167891.1 hypothetical protein [Corynebacterium striatum]HAT1172908.1 hypothetical protein [Corynebacterium striatum]
MVVTLVNVSSGVAKGNVMAQRFSAKKSGLPSGLSEGEGWGFVKMGLATAIFLVVNFLIDTQGWGALVRLILLFIWLAWVWRFRNEQTKNRRVHPRGFGRIYAFSAIPPLALAIFGGWLWIGETNDLADVVVVVIASALSVAPITILGLWFVNQARKNA